MLHLLLIPHFAQKHAQYDKMRPMVIVRCSLRFSVVLALQKSVLRYMIAINSFLLAKNYGEVAGLLGKVQFPTMKALKVPTLHAHYQLPLLRAANKGR